MGKIIEAACEYGVRIANDNSHGYDQNNRWLPDVDCSSFVTLCYENAGVPVRSKGGATYTGNLFAGFTKCGFEAIKFKSSISLVRGDVLFYNYVKNGKTYGHAILYLGNGKIVQASINEKGTITGGKTGDQTGKEVVVGDYYVPSRGWDYVLRYPDEETKQENKKVNITLTELKMGSKGPEVKSLQILLYANGYNCGTADGIFGPKTYAALINFQRARGLKDDGICGKCSWTSILAA